MTEKDILQIIRTDTWMMEILRAVQTLQLSNWMIGAGFVRGKVWDSIHHYKTRTPLSDIDVIYFDKNDTSEKTEKQYELQLQKLLPLNWSVKNQARMHTLHNDHPYKNSEEGLSHWVETATCVGVKLANQNTLSLIAPYGIDDLVHLFLRPTTKTPEGIKQFNERVKKKKWLKKWPKLTVTI